jgi:hypothetical protein
MTTTKPSPPAEGNQRQGAGDHEGAGQVEHSSTKVEIPRDRYYSLVFDAEAWRALRRSPHVVDVLHEFHEWHRRRVISATSRDLSSAGRWRMGPTYRELEERRRLTSVHDCAVCGVAVAIQHPMPRWAFERLPDLAWVRCPEHRGAA